MKAQVLSSLAAALVFAGTGGSYAESVSGIRSRVIQPICPRGGVLMLALTAERPGNGWPQTIDLKLGDYGQLTGQVAWIDQVPLPFDRHWTDDPRGLAIRAILPSDDSSKIQSTDVLGPCLLVQLPADGNGELRLGRQPLQPQWRDVPGIESLQFGDPPRELSADRPALPLTPGPDRPDAVSPFEYWRWALLADRMELNPPKPFGGDIERMAAQYYAALWRIGLNRLTKQSQPIAEQCRQMLTKTCIDRRQPFAAWIMDSGQIGMLLSILLDFRRPDNAVLADTVTWIDQQSPLFFWAESESGDQVRLIIVTPRLEPVTARFTWLGSDDPPVAVQIEPGVLTQVKIDRVALPKAVAIGFPVPPEPLKQILEIEAGGQKFQVPFGPRMVTAKPPGVFFRPLAPPLTLAEAQARVQRNVTEDHATFAHVRRLSGRWEVFFECRRPSAGEQQSPTGQIMPEAMSSFDDLRGIEAVTLVLGPEEGGQSGQAGQTGPMIWLTIPENGFQRVFQGVNDGTLQIHKKSFGDRWFCRVVLPEAWLSAGQTRPALIGCIRSHGDSAQLETGPNTTTPWRSAPARAAINLEQWNDLPQSD